MKKYKLKRLIILIPFIFILAFSSVPAGALSMEQYSDAISVYDALSKNEELKLYTPILFSAFTKTGVNNSTGADLRNIYRFDISHLMDPSDFRYSQGIDVLFRGKDQAGVYSDYYTKWSLYNTSYVAPSGQTPGNQYLRITASPDGSTAGGQSTVTMGMFMLQSEGYFLRSSMMTAAANGVSSMELYSSGSIVDYFIVKYDYSIFGVSTLRHFESSGNNIVTVDHVDGVATFPFLPLDVLSNFWSYEDVFIEHCDITIEVKYNDDAWDSPQGYYEGDIKFTLLGGSKYSIYSNVDDMGSLLTYTDYNDGYQAGYDQGIGVASVESYNNGYSSGYNAGDASGYQRGIDRAYSELDFTSWLGVAATGFLDVPLFGNFTLGGILAVMLAIALVMIFIKFFAGG